MMSKPILATFFLFAVFSLLVSCIQSMDKTSRNEAPRTYIDERKLTDWTVLSPQKRHELREKILSMKSYEECTGYVEQHYNMMIAREYENAMVTPMTLANICRRMKSAGIFR